MRLPSGGRRPLMASQPENKTMTRYATWVVAITIIMGALSGCSSTKPGAGACDPCEAAAVNPTAGPGGTAVGAAATSGQRAGNAPFSGETGFTPNTKTNIGRGEGASTLTSSDRQRRETSSGGAQNIALMNPAQATASAGGGKSAAVTTAERVVNALLAQMALRAARGEDVGPILVELASAQERLASAEAASRANVTNNYHMDGDNTLIGYSRSATGGKEEDLEATKALIEAGGSVIRSKAAPSTAPRATTEASDPPAGAAGNPIVPPPAPPLPEGGE